MSGKTKFFLLVFACLLTMCTSYANPVMHTNGLSCQSYTNHRFFEQNGDQFNLYVRNEGMNCSYICPDGTYKAVSISDTTSSLTASSQEELVEELCDVPPPDTPTPMESLLTVFPVGTDSATPRASRTAQGSPIPSTSAATATASPVGVVTLSPLNSYLAGTVSMCDLGGKLINFRIVQPPPDITGRRLDVQIGEHESDCYVNPTNRSLLTCTLPARVSFPAEIVVRLDRIIVKEFVYSGLGCAVLTTPTPAPRTPRPTSYP